MFERFTKPAREVLLRAVENAEAEASDVDEEHLLYALFRDPHGEAPRVCGDAPPTEEAIRAAYATARRRGGISAVDVEALRELGIDVDEVVSAVENELGADALAAAAPGKSRSGRWFGMPRTRFNEDARQALVQTWREMAELGRREVSEAVLLLGILRRGGLASGVLGELGVTYAEVRARMG